MFYLDSAMAVAAANKFEIIEGQLASARLASARQATASLKEFA
jgi:hypothetical protein